jgi:hypothetical protein
VVLKNPPVSIKVLPLPTENKPKDFKGAVGDFKISAILEKEKIATDDAGNIIVKIEGTGNLQMVNAPVINNPSGMDLYEAKASEDIDKMVIPMKGVKTFTYPFIVSSKGDYTIPPIRFNYFDNNKNSYQTIVTEPLTVHVIEGTGHKAIAEGRGDSTASTKAGTEFKWTIISGLGLMVLFIMWFLTIRKKDKKEADVAIVEKKELMPVIPVSNIEIPKHPLADVDELLSRHDNEHFYSVLNSSLRKYLSEKLNLPAEELNRKKIIEALDKKGVGNGTALLLSSLLENIGVCLYAPVIGNHQMQTDYENANEVISLIEKQLSQAFVNL